jgi:predicted RNase H-like HicB family nuclease
MIIYSPKHYTYTVAWSVQDESYVACVVEFPSLIAHGPTTTAARHELTLLVGILINDMVEAREELPTPSHPW